jgi:hypothetical protein
MLFFQRKRGDATLQPPQDLPNTRNLNYNSAGGRAGGPPLHHSDYLDFSSGYFFSRHSRIPPSIEITLVYPIFCKLSAANAERKPPPQ